MVGLYVLLCLHICPPAYLSVCISACLHICLSVCLSICLSVCLSTCTVLPVLLSTLYFSRHLLEKLSSFEDIIHTAAAASQLTPTSVFIVLQVRQFLRHKLTT